MIILELLHIKMDVTVSEPCFWQRLIVHTVFKNVNNSLIDHGECAKSAAVQCQRALSAYITSNQ